MRLKAPEFTQSAEVEGVPYEVDADGFVTALNPDHAAALQRLGFRDPNAVGAAPSPAPARPAADDEAEAPASAVVQVWDDFPHITAALSAGDGVPPAELTAGELLGVVETYLGDKAAEAANDQGLSIGAFVGAALASAGLSDLSDLSDMQAVLDAVEAQFEPFKAFDPDGDKRPGGSAPPAPDADEALYGSSVLPAIVEVGGYKVQLGAIVAGAFEVFSTGRDAVSVADWNAVPEADREVLLQAFVDSLAETPDTIADRIPAANIVGRPDPAEPTDPAERPDFDGMAHADLKVFLGDRGYKFRGNPAQATLAVQANEYWDAKHGKREA